MLHEIDRTPRNILQAPFAALAAVGFAIMNTAKWTATQVRGRVSTEGTMPSLDGATAWLNSDPLTSAALRGRVILVQFWTYSCIEWLGTLPYVRAWAEKYKDKGLVIIGVHTPEHSFEYDIENVRHAVRGIGVGYPIAIDNHFAIWNAFKNQYSPSLYFVDAMGRIRHHHFGGDAYEESERLIQQLLRETGARDISPELVGAEETGADATADRTNSQSPENDLDVAQTENGSFDRSRR